MVMAQLGTGAEDPVETGSNRFNFIATYRKMQIALKIVLTWENFHIQFALHL